MKGVLTAVFVVRFSVHSPTQIQKRMCVGKDVFKATFFFGGGGLLAFTLILFSRKHSP